MVEISVIIPVYNVKEYLEECLDSVVNQSFKDLEIICVNDSSTDNSPDILKEYQNKDSRIKIINQNNYGLSNARNHGFEHTQGKYIYFMDSDDYLELNALEKVYSISEEKNLDLLIFKIINFNDKTGKENYTYSNIPFLLDIDKDTFTYLDFKENLLRVDVTVYSKFFKKELINNARFPEGLIFEDNTFYIDYILKASRIYFLDECLYHRRIRENSIITKASKNHADLIEIYKIMADKLKCEGLYDEFKEKLFNNKIGNIYNRFCDINPKYKQFFYKKMKNDFISQKKEYENEFDLKKIHEHPKKIFTSVINSNDYNEIESYMKVYTLKKRADELKKENEKLKKKNKKLKKELKSNNGIRKSQKVNGEIIMVQISVIIPVYNCEKYLKQCLDSICYQTFKDLEIICINDGSTDNSLEILKEYQNRDSRISIINQENKGAGASRNVGINKSSGEYIYFADSDDYLELDAFERLSSAYFDKKFDFIMFKINNFYEESNETINDDYYNMPYLKDCVGSSSFSYEDVSDFALELCVCPPGNLFKHELIKDIRFPEALLFEDNVFFTHALFKAENIYFYDEYIYNRRRHKDSTTTQLTVKSLDTIDITNLLLDLCTEFNHNEHKKELYYRIFNNIYRIFKKADPSQKEAFFKKIKQDYIKNKDKWEKDSYFKNKLHPKYKHIFNCAIKSQNARKFEKCVDNYKKGSIFKKLRNKIL